MTFRKIWPTETLPIDEWGDTNICICNIQSGLPKAKECIYHYQYHHLVWYLYGRSGSIIYSPHRCKWYILLPSNGNQFATEENWWIWSFLEQHLISIMKLMIRRHYIEVEIEHIGMSDMTVSQQAYHVTTRCHCNNFGIRSIWISYTTVSQQLV